MAVGQSVLGEAVLDVAELDRLSALIEAEEQDRSVRHARQLRHVLALHRVYGRAGMELSTPAYLALLLGSSETRATRRLADAQTLEGLGALGPMLDGLLTVEQARVVVDLLGPLDPGDGAALWQRLAARLEADRLAGVVRPPSRLRELLTRWLVAMDPEGMAERRREAARQDADVELWPRDDGLADLVGRGLSAADALACLDRLDQLAASADAGDTRSAGERRRDAFVDLLLGRQSLPLGAGCCPPGSSAPCGAQILVHVPLATALGDTAEPAELVGHGPLDPGALSDLLQAAPVLRRVWVDEHGTPVALDRRRWAPAREGLAHALPGIASGAPPPDAQMSRHRHDDPTPYRAAPTAAAAGPRPLAPMRVARLRTSQRARRRRLRPRPRRRLAARRDVRVQPGSAVPPSSPREAAGLVQAPASRRQCRVDRAHRTQVDQSGSARRPGARPASAGHPRRLATARSLSSGRLRLDRRLRVQVDLL